MGYLSPKVANFDIGIRVVAGIKACRYLISPAYRARVNDYWRMHPDARAAHIALMISGVLINIFLLGLLLLLCAVIVVAFLDGR